MAVLDGVNWFCTIVRVIVDVVDASTSQLCFPQKNWNSWFMLLHIVTHSFSGSCDQLVIICSTNNHHWGYPPAINWLVVWNIFFFHNIYGMWSKTHWRTPSFFKMGTLHHQRVLRRLERWMQNCGWLAQSGGTCAKSTPNMGSEHGEYPLNGICLIYHIVGKSGVSINFCLNFGCIVADVQTTTYHTIIYNNTMLNFTLWSQIIWSKVAHHWVLLGFALPEHYRCCNLWLQSATSGRRSPID